MTTSAEAAEFETLAVELAQVAGAQIVASLGRTLTVRYKGAEERAAADIYRDPVSDVDHAVEVTLRARLADRFPDHDIIGEEIDEQPEKRGRIVWAVDPVDGTANFVNGFPLFGAIIGVLDEGRPVAGAIWCSTSHALRAGVYHARDGGSLCFDGTTLNVERNPAVMRRIVGMPRLQASSSHGYDIRQTGSAAIECAFVAAGLMAAAKFDRPNLWDAAGGVPLIKAGGGVVLTRRSEAEAWAPFERFSGINGDGDPYGWKQPMLIGNADAVGALAKEG
ncbi:inositol monophosphatase family protein [Mangrovicella endophytica]|uniref:inositol monophosphatase family protein n=1 Tax=Mangrovicella endophytica TaxID=2066697 RepID=UPI000C9E73EE|nr:inositol monophosphatase family protein [Mangrovicella endophytica]